MLKMDLILEYFDMSEEKFEKHNRRTTEFVKCYYDLPDYSKNK